MNRCCYSFVSWLDAIKCYYRFISSIESSEEYINRSFNTHKFLVLIQKTHQFAGVIRQIIKLICNLPCLRLITIAFVWLQSLLIDFRSQLHEILIQAIQIYQFRARSCLNWKWHFPFTGWYQRSGGNGSSWRYGMFLIDKQTNRQTDKQTNRQTDKQTNRQTDKQTNRQTDKQTIRQTDKQTNRQTIFLVNFKKSYSPIRQRDIDQVSPSPILLYCTF